MKPVKGSAPRFEVGPRNRGGRPRLSSEPMSSVSTCLPVSAHDRLCKVAAAQEKSVAEVVRNILILNIVNVTVIQSDKR